MFNQDRTNDALGLLKRMTDDIEANIRSPETVYIEVIFLRPEHEGPVPPWEHGQRGGLRHATQEDVARHP